MKTTKIQFGFSAVQAGQKSSTVNAEPRLIVNCTAGKFTITSPVTKALNVAVGENVMFFNNISEIEKAIKANNADILAYAEENGIDLSTAEGQSQVITEFTIWGIAKGYAKFDSKGNPLQTSERYTKADKQKYIDDNYVDIVAQIRPTLIERNNGEDADDETLKAFISVDDIESPKVQDYEGSKTMTASNATGVGCQLSFTDTAIWNAMKADLKEKDKKNRVYSVELDSPFTAQAHNGKELVDIVVYPLTFVSDEDPIVREKKN